MPENEEVEKKPIYKKWWFWTIIVIIVIGIAGSSSDNNTPTNSPNAQVSTNGQSNTENTLDTNIVEKKEVEVIDFSTMSKENIQNWCTSNNIDCDIKNQYSDTIPVDGFVSQNPQANTKIYEEDKVIVTYSLGKEPTLGERNALAKANDYLDFSAFSYTGLIDQLEYEGFTKEEATYGADNCGADWNEQAAKKAQQYMDYSSFSKSRLIDQLKYEGFTAEQAQYGAAAVGY